MGVYYGCLIIYGVYWTFFDMRRLPTGDFLTKNYLLSTNIR
ncbi:DUF5412 family protein [Peribacillus butanolivorans]